MRSETKEEARPGSSIGDHLHTRRLFRGMWRWSVIVVAFVLGLATGVALVVIVTNKLHRMSEARIARVEVQRLQELPPPWLPTLARLSPAARHWVLLPMHDGAASITLGQLEGRPILLGIWATWCAPCIAEMPSLQALSRQPAAARLSFVLVSTERKEVVRDFLHRRTISLPFYVASAPVPREFSGSTLPVTFIIARDGRLVARQLGAAKWDDPKVAAFLSGLEGKN
jgi:thiol-disulfide isomerase/thioredoxin